MWEGYRRHTGPELATAKFGTGGMAQRAAVYCERIVVAHIHRVRELSAAASVHGHDGRALITDS